MSFFLFIILVFPGELLLPQPVFQLFAILFSQFFLPAQDKGKNGVTQSSLSLVQIRLIVQRIDKSLHCLVFFTINQFRPAQAHIIIAESGIAFFPAKQLSQGALFNTQPGSPLFQHISGLLGLSCHLIQIRQLFIQPHGVFGIGTLKYLYRHIISAVADISRGNLAQSVDTGIQFPAVRILHVLLQIFQGFLIICHTQIQIGHIHGCTGLQIPIRIKQHGLAQADDGLLIIPLMFIYLAHTVQGVNLLGHISQYLFIVRHRFFIMMSRLVENSPLHQQIGPRRMVKIFRQLREPRLIEGEISVFHMLQKNTSEFLHLFLHQFGADLMVFLIGIGLQIRALNAFFPGLSQQFFQFPGVVQIQIYLGHVHIGSGIVGKELDQLAARLYHAGSIPLSAVSLQRRGQSRINPVLLHQAFHQIQAFLVLFHIQIGLGTFHQHTDVMRVDGLHGVRLLQSLFIVGRIQIPQGAVALHTDGMGLAQPVLILLQGFALLRGNSLLQGLPPPFGVADGFLIFRRLPVEFGHQAQVLLQTPFGNAFLQLLHPPDSQGKTFVLQITPAQFQYVSRTVIETCISLQFLFQAGVDLLKQLMEIVIITGGQHLFRAFLCLLILPPVVIPLGQAQIGRIMLVIPFLDSLETPGSLLRLPLVPQ